MDETLTRVGDRRLQPALYFDLEGTRSPQPKLGEMDTELFKEWFQALSQHAGLCLHVENLYGANSHHIVESCFKATARALRQGDHAGRAAGRRRSPQTKATLSGV